MRVTPWVDSFLFLRKKEHHFSSKCKPVSGIHDRLLSDSTIFEIMKRHTLNCSLEISSFSAHRLIRIDWLKNLYSSQLFKIFATANSSTQNRYICYEYSLIISLLFRRDLFLWRQVIFEMIIDYVSFWRSFHSLKPEINVNDIYTSRAWGRVVVKVLRY